MNIISIAIGADVLLHVRCAVHNGMPRLRVRPPISAVRQMGRTDGHDGITPQSLDSPVSPAYSLPTIVSLVGAGLGVALVPASMRSVQPPDVTYRPLADAREHSELAVAFRRVERAPATKAFIEQMRGVAKRLVDPRLVEGSEEHTKYFVTGSGHDSLSGTESRGSSANGRSNQRVV